MCSFAFGIIWDKQSSRTLGKFDTGFGLIQQSEYIYKNCTISHMLAHTPQAKLSITNRKTPKAHSAKFTKTPNCIFQIDDCIVSSLTFTIIMPETAAIQYSREAYVATICTRRALINYLPSLADICGVSIVWGYIRCPTFRQQERYIHDGNRRRKRMVLLSHCGGCALVLGRYCIAEGR